LFYQLHSSGGLGPVPICLGKRAHRWRAVELEAWVQHNCPPRTVWLKLWREGPARG